MEDRWIDFVVETRLLRVMKQEAQEQTCLVCLETMGPLQNGICYDTPDLYVDSNSWRLRCGHVVCLGCLRTWIQTKLQDEKEESQGRNAGIKCVRHDCPRPIRPCHLSSILEPPWLDKFIQRGMTSVYCPNSTCSHLIRVPVSAAIAARLPCPRCCVELCISCRSLWHEAMDCRTFKRHVDASEAERLVQECIAQHGWKRCPGCHVIVERIDGCSHISCKWYVKRCWSSLLFVVLAVTISATSAANHAAPTTIPAAIPSK
ncbi:hypothetical protein LEN26_011909 [Aphanomyces euteiches]|nr:hypothetical protein AeMF1_010020 [Aphanomyces euteiches]KAH9118834.1 hypothetical protein LEN26_011909 [Aphanomyces euteiches]KAH9131524.1 hypothetical protein AeNC1_019583 [Aphanomyces euteiches]